MFASEAQLNQRASSLQIEEIFTDNDINKDSEYDPSMGYSFDYPFRWLEDKSQYKMIGIRRLQLIPTNHIFKIGLEIQEKDVVGKTTITTQEIEIEYKPAFDNGSVGEHIYTTKRTFKEETYKQLFTTADPNAGQTTPIGLPLWDHTISFIEANNIIRRVDTTESDGSVVKHLYARKEEFQIDKKSTCTDLYEFNILEGNTLEEVIHQMMNKFNESGAFRFQYDYSYNTGSLSFMVWDNMKSFGEFVNRPFMFTTGGNEDYSRFFLKFLNQNRDDATVTKYFSSYEDSHDFYGVWNRARLQFHASFSNCNRQFIGSNNDFWEKPSKLFKAPTNSSNFYIRFTTDGQNIILPKYCKFTIELCFIINYKNSLALQ